MELGIDRFVLGIHELERVNTESVHMAVPIRTTAIREDAHELQKRKTNPNHSVAR